MPNDMPETRQIALREARNSDMQWLVDLRMQTMAGYIEATGELLSLDDQTERVLRNFESIRVVVQGDQDIGMIKVERLPECWKLVQVQLLPQFQRQGIGTELIEGLIADARGQGVSVALSVLKVNPAKSLYDRLGFYTTRQKEHSYEMRMDV